MDSGNSGSLQSSSGDEEHDSRAAADSISAFMNNNNRRRRTVQANPLSNVPSQINTTHFDPLSNYFDNISRPPPPPPPPAVHTPNSFLNLDMPWSKTLRSDHPNSSTDHHINPAMISNIPSFFGSFTTATPSPEISINHPPPVAENNSTTSASTAPPPRHASDQSNPTHVVRNPKKRSRASRRAPTTVLTTDTTNFRAMVQEFTGIPAPPFTSSPFSRTTSRLDLYGTTPQSMRSNIPLDSSQPPYLRRPFPQKVQLPPPPLPFLASSSSSSSSSSLLNSTTMVVDLDHANNIASSTAAAAAALNFQLPPQSNSSATNLFSNMPNHPILSSLLQSKFPTSNPPPNIGLEIPSKDSHHKVGGIILDHQFGHVNTSSLSGLPGLISPDQTTSRNNNNDNNPVINWDGNGNGNLNLARMNAATNGKINYSASTNSSNFHGDKVTDNVVTTSRGEGMVESWICSSD